MSDGTHVETSARADYAAFIEALWLTVAESHGGRAADDVVGRFDAPEVARLIDELEALGWVVRPYHATRASASGGDGWRPYDERRFHPLDKRARVCDVCRATHQVGADNPSEALRLCSKCLRHRGVDVTDLIRFAPVKIGGSL